MIDAWKLVISCRKKMLKQNNNLCLRMQDYDVTNK